MKKLELLDFLKMQAQLNKRTLTEEKKIFAKRIKTTKAYMDQLIYKFRIPSANMALRIETATGGAVHFRTLLLAEKRVDVTKKGEANFYRKQVCDPDKLKLK